MLTSPYTWSEQHTPRDKWLGGFKADTGESFTTLEGLTKALSADFMLLGQPIDIPFLMRETGRSFQYGVSELTIWKKKDTPSA